MGRRGNLLVQAIAFGAFSVDKLYREIPTVAMLPRNDT